MGKLHRLTAAALCVFMLCGCGDRTPAKEAASPATGEQAEVSEDSGREEDTAPQKEQVDTEVPPQAQEEKEPELTAEAVTLPDAGWQKDVTMPDWKGYVDDTLAMNGMLSFRGYEGQGSLYVTPSDTVTGFSMYVNGHRVDTSSMSGGTTWKIDMAEAAVNGINTLQISEIEPWKSAKIRVCVPYPEIITGSAQEEGIAPESLEFISDIIDADVEEGFPGAQLAVIRNGRLVYEGAWGSVNAYLPDGSRNTGSEPVTTDTLFDLASVTKVFSVNYALQKLVTDGKVKLDDRVADYIGECFYTAEQEETYAGDVGLEMQQEWKSELTIRDLMRHQSGFSGDPKYYRPYVDIDKPADDPENENMLYAGYDGSEETREATIDAICRTPLRYEPGTRTVYSDINYMLLGVVVESIVGQDLNTWLKENIWDPMGLERITYKPLENGFSASDCAVTEINGNTRGGNVSFPGVRTKTIQGEVHDELAYYSMGGISGHAGLFANATDLAKLASLMLTGGYGENRFFSRNVLDTFTAPKKEDAANWGLGWYREGDDQRVWYFGTQSDPDTIGHQGWTGTIVMIDPSRELVVVYLTHKINSPLTVPEEDLNKFEGSSYTSSTLGFVPQILSVGMDEGRDVSAQLAALAAEMASDEMRLIADDVWVEHPLVRSMRARLKVLRKWAEKGGDDMEHEIAIADGLEQELRYLEDPDSSVTDDILAGMSTRQKIAQMLMPSIRYWGEGDDAQNVTMLGKELAEAVEKYSFGGIILFSQNIENAEQTAELVKALQEANAKGNACSKLMISIDQEGGGVTRLTTGTQMPGNMALGATGDKSCAKKAAQVIGEELAALGINVDFAPVLDVNNNPDNPIIGVRSFSDDPETVGTYGRAFQSGLHSRGIITSLKHFPGHGDTDTDSHTGLPMIDKSLEELMDNELVPYIRNLRYSDIVMTAHIQYPQIEQDTYISREDGNEIVLPATLSSDILDGVLRQQLGYKGVICTDAMEMDAISKHFDPIDAAKLAIGAGADILLIPVNMTTDEGIARMEEYIDTLAALVESGEIDEGRIDAAVTRILKLKYRYGLLRTDPDKDAETESGNFEVGSYAHHETEWELALRAVTMLKNDDDLLPLSDVDKVVIACPYNSEINSGEYAVKRLKEEKLIPDETEVRVISYSNMTEADAADVLGDAQAVIGISALYSEAEMDPKGEKGTGAAFLDALIGETHKAGGRFILLSAQLPYDTARYQEADAILACYNARGMTEIPGESGDPVPQYGPNVPAALYTILGGSSPTGKLPVNIPKLDSGYEYSDEILYSRGTGLRYP